MEHSEEWLLNVQKLNQYAGAFTGRKLVILRTGDRIVEAEQVKKAFSFDVEFIELPNSPSLQEVSGFIEVLSKLENTNVGEKTFYAHTKGVRYGAGDRNIPAIRLWRDAMYEKCLSDIERVDDVLKTHACCGCFRQKTCVTSSWDVTWSCPWIFSGSFWWVNNAALFSHPKWRDIVPNSIYATEAYLGRLFPVEQSFCLADKGVADLYTLGQKSSTTASGKPKRPSSRIRNSRWSVSNT